MWPRPASAGTARKRLAASPALAGATFRVADMAELGFDFGENGRVVDGGRRGPVLAVGPCFACLSRSEPQLL